jgi:hypothetical protein
MWFGKRLPTAYGLHLCGSHKSLNSFGALGQSTHQQPGAPVIDVINVETSVICQLPVPVSPILHRYTA